MVQKLHELLWNYKIYVILLLFLEEDSFSIISNYFPSTFHEILQNKTTNALKFSKCQNDESFVFSEPFLTYQEK